MPVGAPLGRLMRIVRVGVAITLSGRLAFADSVVSRDGLPIRAFPYSSAVS
jgi:hypothetical protein